MERLTEKDFFVLQVLWDGCDDQEKILNAVKDRFDTKVNARHIKSLIKKGYAGTLNDKILAFVSEDEYMRNLGF